MKWIAVFKEKTSEEAQSKGKEIMEKLVKEYKEA